MPSKRTALALTGLFALFVLWAALPVLGLSNPLYLPSIWKTARAGASLLRDGQYWSDVAVTLRRAGIGLTLSAAVGIPTGLMLGTVRWAYALTTFPVDFVRSVPAAAVLPLFIVFFGLGDASKIAVVFYGCVFVFVVGAMYGARGGPESAARREAVRAMGASRIQTFVVVVVPEALLSVATSLRLAVSYALVLVIFTEMFLGADDGLGRRLIDCYLALKIPEMYVYIVTLGLAGITANKLCELLETRYVSIRR